MTILYKQNTFSIDVNGEWVQIGNQELLPLASIQLNFDVEKWNSLKDGETFEVDGIGYTLEKRYIEPPDHIHCNRGYDQKVAILHLIEQPKGQSNAEGKGYKIPSYQEMKDYTTPEQDEAFKNNLSKFVEDLKMEIKQPKVEQVEEKREIGLPSFLYLDGYTNEIKVGVHGDSIVTDAWNEFINKLKK